VFSAFVIAWRFAMWPTSRLPFSAIRGCPVLDDGHARVGRAEVDADHLFSRHCVAIFLSFARVAPVNGRKKARLRSGQHAPNLGEIVP
jgi:hypothetical protein